MGYLICKKCGSYYELQEGESPNNFSDKCDCGGKLIYQESLDRPKIVISFWKAIKILFLLILGLILLMFIYNAGNVSNNPAYIYVGLILQLLLALPVGIFIVYLILMKAPGGYLTPLPLYAKMKIVGTSMVGLILIILVIGDQLVRLGRENPYITPYIDIVNVMTLILFIIGIIIGLYAHRTKYMLIE